MTGPKDDDADREQTDRSEPDRPEGELDADEVDERFAALIAGFEDSPAWPDQDEDDEDEDEDEPAAARPRPVANTAASDTDEPTLLELWDTELPEDPDDPEDTYNPPPPPPVPRPSAPAILGVLLIVGGLTLVISPSLLGVGRDLGMLTGIAAFLGGAAMLVWRLRPEPDDEDSDPDNGAVV